MSTLSQYLEQQPQPVRTGKRFNSATLASSNRQSEQQTYRLDTVRFGSLEVSPEQVWSFVLPLIGFDHVSDYVLIEHAPDSPFYWLQAVQDANLAFVLTQPVLFGLDYSITLPEWTLELLGQAHPEQTPPEAQDMSVYTLVTLPENPKENPHQMTANLVAPIVLYHPKAIENDTIKHRQLGMQLVLTDSPYTTRTPLLPQNKA
jgi:flagellar assembly factor FliW